MSFGNKTTPMVSPFVSDRSGRAVTNQYIISYSRGDRNYIYFQSYKTMIVMVVNGKVTLDTGALDYSVTTSRHLFKFLSMNRKEIEAAIASGKFRVRNLNK